MASGWQQFVRAIQDTFFFWSSEPEEDPEQTDRSNEIAMETFRTKISAYRSSFNPYQKSAPGFDYVNWKPYGTYRQEDPAHTYATTCRGLAPYVRDVVTAACQGIEEQRWDAMTVSGQQRIQERVSRAASRETLLGS